MHRELHREDDVQKKNPHKPCFGKINGRITHQSMAVLVVGIWPDKEQEIACHVHEGETHDPQAGEAHEFLFSDTRAQIGSKS
jgi:hypothetical protein